MLSPLKERPSLPTVGEGPDDEATKEAADEGGISKGGGAVCAVDDPSCGAGVAAGANSDNSNSNSTRGGATVQDQQQSSKAGDAKQEEAEISPEQVVAEAPAIVDFGAWRVWGVQGVGYRGVACSF